LSGGEAPANLAGGVPLKDACRGSTSGRNRGVIFRKDGLTRIAPVKHHHEKHFMETCILAQAKKDAVLAFSQKIKSRIIRFCNTRDSSGRAKARSAQGEAHMVGETMRERKNERPTNGAIHDKQRSSRRHQPGCGAVRLLRTAPD
jgi:hypothetical protein